MAARKFHVVSYRDHHIAFEVVPHGERAVSQSYCTKAEAERAIALIQQTGVARIKLGG